MIFLKRKFTWEHCPPCLCYSVRIVSVYRFLLEICLERSYISYFIEVNNIWCHLRDECQTIWVLEFQNISDFFHQTEQLCFGEILDLNCIVQLSGGVILVKFLQSSPAKRSKHHSYLASIRCIQTLQQSNTIFAKHKLCLHRCSYVSYSLHKVIANLSRVKFYNSNNNPISIA